jgi:hypothetical protein
MNGSMGCEGTAEIKREGT